MSKSVCVLHFVSWLISMLVFPYGYGTLRRTNQKKARSLRVPVLNTIHYRIIKILWT